MVCRWFGANMAGQRNKNAFKFLLILLILSQKHIFGVKKVVWDGLDVVWGGLEVVWGGLGWFGVVWGVSTDPSRFHLKRLLGSFIWYPFVLLLPVVCGVEKSKQQQNA